MPVKKILKQQTAVISIPDKLLNDKDKIVNGLTKKGNLVRKSVIIKSNDGNDIKILKKGIKEGSTNNNSSSSPPKEKKVKVVKEKKVKEPKEKKIKVVKEKKVKEPKEKTDETLSPSFSVDGDDYIFKFPNNMKTYKKRIDGGRIEIKKIKSIEKRYYKYVKPEGYIDFDDMNNIIDESDIIHTYDKLGKIKRSNFGTTISTLIPFSLLTYFFNKKYKFITDEELTNLKHIYYNKVDVITIVIEHYISNIEIQAEDEYPNFNYCCLIIPTIPKAKRIWLSAEYNFDLDDILGRGLIMIFELKTNKILREKPNDFYMGQILDDDFKKRPEVYKELGEMLKDFKIPKKKK